MFKRLDEVTSHGKNLSVLAFGDLQSGKTYSVGTLDKRGLVYKSMIELLHFVKLKRSAYIYTSIWLV